MDSYGGLITAVKDFSGRDDATTAKVDYFIDVTESWFNNNLRVHEMETTNGSLTVSNGVITHPSDFLQWKQIGITSNGSRYQLTPMDLEQRSFVDDGTTGTPQHYIVRGNGTVLVPTPDSSSYAIDGTYYQKIPALTQTIVSNWVLASYPDAYLFGCLTVAGTYFTGLEHRFQTWRNMFKEATDGIKRTSQLKGFGQVMTLRAERPAD